MKKLLKILSNRFVMVGISILLQVVLLMLVILKFNSYFVFFYAICILISIGAVLYIVNKNINPEYKIAWIIPIMLFPIFGGLFYLLFGGNQLSRHEIAKMSHVFQREAEAYPIEHPVLDKLAQENIEAGNQARYISKFTYSPVFEHTSTEFLPSGEAKFTRMLEELRKAEHFIFLEYFIIENGVMWDSILEILEEKAAQGVDVRLIYDDMGCLFTLPYNYYQQMEEKGIQCQTFNRFIPMLSSKFNNRDHRKICVIDGWVGFTGGVNLADEYINEYEKHGHWRDAAILLKGDAVWELTVMFLSMWDYIVGENDRLADFAPTRYCPHQIENDGYVVPFGDTPLDHEIVGETVYMNLINKAKKYIYINTPYLIIDNEMTTALCNAAKQGVDVRIMTPHVPDKKIVYALTRSYYNVLVENGVKIYEYTPGFNHAKTFVVDDEYGVVGTINLDFRSLYLHFECAVWMYRSSCVKHIKEDFLKTLEQCQKITLSQCHNINGFQRLGRAILRVFAPLM